MKPHKWVKEIKAWADGADIESRTNDSQAWIRNETPAWNPSFQYRIKPQPKEPQYLYVYKCRSDGKYEFTKSMIYNYPKIYIGKIKLEVDDE